MKVGLTPCRVITHYPSALVVRVKVLTSSWSCPEALNLNCTGEELVLSKLTIIILLTLLREKSRNKCSLQRPRHKPLKCKHNIFFTDEIAVYHYE